MVSFHQKMCPVKKGFSLVEVLVAMFIFALVMTVVAQIFGSTLLNYRQAKIMQQNLEDAEFAMNTIAKVLRTSTVTFPTVSGAESRIFVFDYSQSKCFKYRLNFNGSNLLEVQTGTNTTALPEKPVCDFSSSPPAVPMVNADVSGSFEVTLSDPIDPLVSGTGAVGRVVINLTVGTGSQAQTLQTTVSLRDYEYVGL